MKTNDLVARTTDSQVRVVARLARVFETRLGEESMTLPQFRLLAFLSDREGAASALAEWLEVSRPSVTALVDGLVERRWVERRESPEDRRRVLHQITDDGRAVLASSSACLAAALDDLFDHLDEDERTAAHDGLDAMATALHRNWEAKHA